MRKALDLRVFCLLFAAFACQSASAKFFPVNGGMVNQATVLTANILTPSTFVATGNQVIVVEGTDNQILKLPNATKLPLDWWYRVLNNSTGYVTVRDGSGADIASVNTTRAGEFYLKARSSAAGTWKKQVSASAAELDANYYLKTDFVSVSAGVSSAGKPIKLNGSGQVDTTMLPASSGVGWALTGNAGLSAAANYLGTNDAVDLVFKTSGVEWFRITSAGVLTTQLAGGLVKSTAGALGIAVSGTDYAPATSGSAILKGNGAGGFASAVAGTDYVGATSGSAVQKANGAGGLAAAVADTDYQAPITLTTFGSTPNNNGLTFSGDVLSMQPADATHGGGVSITTQTFAGNKTFTGTGTWSVAGAASAPAITFSAAPFAGTATTSKAHTLWEWGSPTSTNWGTVGNVIGINQASGGTVNFLNFQVNGAMAYRANYQGGLTLWNTNDNANYLGSLTLCNTAADPASSNNCVSLYQSNGGIFNIYAPNASQGATNMMRFGNATGIIAIGASTLSTTGQVSFQVNNFVAYNARNTVEILAKGSQTGHLLSFQSSGLVENSYVDTLGKFWLAALDMTSHPITNVTDPTNAQDAATKNYVDTHTSATSPVVRTVTANTVATTGDDFILCNSATGDLVVTLYTAASASRKQLQVKDISQSGTCTVNPASTAEGIFISTGNEAQVILSPRGNALGFEPDGSSTWYVF